MATHSRQLAWPAFEQLREQLATATALCSQDQILDLADILHEAIRRRRTLRFEGAYRVAGAERHFG